jgi:hypothetical protein
MPLSDYVLPITLLNLLFYQNLLFLLINNLEQFMLYLLIFLVGTGLVIPKKGVTCATYNNNYIT